MAEDVHGRETREVEANPIRQISECRPCETVATFAREHHVEFFAQRVEVEDVRRRVGDLGVAQRLASLSEDCCCLEISIPNSSRTRSFRPWRSV